ncbi:hypothetical protein VpaJT1_70 [Vibrio phage VpaJT_1]|nr:hypothetical protein VpaJT1_70 [Vibrio phage VpaJT_1]
MTVTLDGGKYRIENNNGVLQAYRHGGPWRDLAGDNLIYHLVHRVSELTEAANKAADQLDIVAGLTNTYNEEATDWLIDNHGKNKELAENLRDATEA